MRDCHCSRLYLLGSFAAALAATTSVSLQAQSSSVRPSTADQAWATVTALSRTAAESKVTKVGFVASNRSEADKVKSEREQRAQKFRATAQGAKDFHTQNPNHPRVTEARKLEALAGLQGINPTDKNHQLSALATATAFRTNKAYPVADRIAVAHAMESRGITQKLPGHPWFTNPVLAETMLDRLLDEFGHRPEIWARFLGLAENTYCDAGRETAYRIVQSSYAPESTKAAARRILERYALVRRPLDFPLVPTQGKPTTLGELAGKTTVVCLWDGTKHPEGPPGLRDFKKNPLPNTNWVYISVGALAQLQKGRNSNAAPPGTTCVESLGRRSAVVSKLKITQLPYVFVLDDKKQLSGYGRIDEIPALIAGIGRPALP